LLPLRDNPLAGERAVSDVRNNDPSLIKPIVEQ
jgi:hypothetical protein